MSKNIYKLISCMGIFLVIFGPHLLSILLFSSTAFFTEASRDFLFIMLLDYGTSGIIFSLIATLLALIASRNQTYVSLNKITILLAILVAMWHLIVFFTGGAILNN